MTDRNRPDDLDRLLAFEDSTEDAALRELLTHLRDSLTSPPPESTATRHLAELTRVAAEHAHLEPAPALRATWRRRAAHVFGYTATKVALGVGVAAAATGGLAASDSLPDPVQRAVSTGASYVGVDFPYPEDRLAELEVPVEELPDPDTGVADERPADDRARNTQGAGVDAPADGPADEAPVEDAPPADAPPVDTPRDGEGEVPPAGEDNRPDPPVDSPPADPPVQDDHAGDDGTKAASSTPAEDAPRP